MRDDEILQDEMRKKILFLIDSFDTSSKEKVLLLISTAVLTLHVLGFDKSETLEIITDLYDQAESYEQAQRQLNEI